MRSVLQPDAGGPLSLQWRVPGKPYSVVLSATAAATLAQVCTAAQPRGGGLLYGHVLPGEVECVVVAECIPLQWDRDRGGAPYRTPQQHAQWKQAPAGNQNRTLVGYFRADSEFQPRLDAEDVALQDRYLPHTLCVCLLVQVSQGRAAASLFLRPPGRMLDTQAASDLELPLHRMLAMPGEQPGKLAGSAFQAQGFQAQNWMSAAAWLVGLALVALASRSLWLPAVIAEPHRAAGELHSTVPFTSTLVTSTSPVPLTLHRAGEVLRVRWDSKSNRALCGIMDIEENGQHQSVFLSRAELDAGTYQYQPAGAWIAFQLRLLTAGKGLIATSLQYFDGGADDRFSALQARFVPLPALEDADGGTETMVCGEPRPAQGRREEAARAIDGPRFTSVEVSSPLDADDLQISAEVLLDEQGVVRDILGSGPPEVWRELLSGLHQWRFAPAMRNGVPVAGSVKFYFNLPEEAF